MVRLTAFLLAAALVVAALGHVLFGQRVQKAPVPTLHELVVEGEKGPVLLKVEIASTPETWRRGLMFRKSLPEDHGLLFIFPQATGSAFWMKNTYIPLSIAFADQNGKILRILDMEPCTKDPCLTYYPGVAYRQALEVNQGWFARHGVKEGDRWRLK